MNLLTEQVLDFARSWGAAVVGVATRETLAGGPPSVDLEYVLPGARSAVSIAVPLNKDYIRSYLAKKDRRSHDRVFSGVRKPLPKFMVSRPAGKRPTGSPELQCTPAG